MKPVLKYPGGKSKLLPWIKEYLPHTDSYAYCEPFVGAGSVLTGLDPQSERIFINDLNPTLYSWYKFLAYGTDNDFWQFRELLFESVFEDFLDYEDMDKRREFYLEKRTQFNQTKDEICKCVLLVFLSHTCFNGLFRVNSKGEFNVPMGSYTNFNLSRLEENLEKHRAYFKSIAPKLSISNLTYNKHIEEVIEYAPTNKRIFIYCDPPYCSQDDGKSAFTGYTKEQFGIEENLGLLEFLSNCPCNVLFLLSNINRSELLGLAKEKGLHVHTKECNFVVGGGDRVKPCLEVLISNYK